jgi:hypothetical protein
MRRLLIEWGLPVAFVVALAAAALSLAALL